jgi:folate-binding protein YgfZ
VQADGELLWLGGGWLTPEGFRALGPRAALAGRLAALGVPALEPDKIDRLRAEAFVPAFGPDFGGRNFPQEARLEPAISFTKGCYIGQEIVARIHSRGAVNRLLVQLGTEGDVPLDAEIRAEGKKVGEVTTSGSGRALGYVRKVDAEPGTTLEIAGSPATVLYPPLS